MSIIVKGQKGFTIVELMIATSVLSMLLLIATVIMTGIGTLYNKGVNQSNLQDSARAIIDDIAQNLQATSGDVSANIGLDGGGGKMVTCLGDTRYTYVLSKQIGPQTKHALWRDDTPSDGCVTGAPDIINTDPLSGSEMVAPRSRLSNLDISANNGVYKITVYETLGEDDLLDRPTDTDPHCTGHSGDQFCATASLQTTVVQRITGSE